MMIRVLSVLIGCVCYFVCYFTSLNAVLCRCLSVVLRSDQRTERKGKGERNTDDDRICIIPAAPL